VGKVDWSYWKLWEWVFGMNESERKKILCLQQQCFPWPPILMISSGSFLSLSYLDLVSTPFYPSGCLPSWLLVLPARATFILKSFLLAFYIFLGKFFFLSTFPYPMAERGQKKALYFSTITRKIDLNVIFWEEKIYMLIIKHIILDYIASELVWTYGMSVTMEDT